MKIGMDVSSHDENDAACDNEDEDEAGDDSFIDVVFGFLATISVIFFPIRFLLGDEGVLVYPYP